MSASKGDKQQRLMKDGLNAEAIMRISKSLEKVSPDFNAKGFQEDALIAIENLELKQRVEALIEVLHQFLPEDYPEAAKILLCLKPYWDWGDPNDSLRGFAAWPLIDYSAVYGLQHPELALSVLKELTALFSAEFAIRSFFIQHYELTYSTVIQWLQDEDYHVRRLVSEGSRPRLPWGLRLQGYVQDPEPLRNILHELKDDQEDYVYRSVANNLNDISKDHPEWVIDLCKQWQNQGAGESCQWVIKHATRSLVKTGHPKVFSLLGYSENPNVKLSNLQLGKQHIRIGESLEFSFTLHNAGVDDLNCVVDYAVHYLKANGKTSPKVYKLKTVSLKAGESLAVSKKQSFKLTTTRQLYPGEHQLAIMVNGVEQKQIVFSLSES